ncbi:hypothetical protein [Fusobacterium perfoetens]|uniref:hypothetical protein n=1 Tax=Fusobacterium perfoetens TaxID=852 RepID=UPI000489F33A|nr:hypothetical protein [Fusobacterium perfoetens]
MAHVNVIKETRKFNQLGIWDLAFQYCEYIYDDGTSEYGYRFIWITPEGKLQPARGQARILSISDILNLVSQSLQEGWGNIQNKK